MEISKAIPLETEPAETKPQGTESVNEFCCVLQRVIEDTFSVVVCFRQEGQTLEEPDTLLTWIVGKESWDSVKEEVLSGRFHLYLDPARLMLLT